MTTEKTATEAFLASAAQAAKTIQETTERNGSIQIFSHLDADGIAAAGIITKALWRLDARFQTRITQWIDEKIITEITAHKPQLVILTDFGSGYLNLLNQKIPNQKIQTLDNT